MEGKRGEKAFRLALLGITVVGGLFLLTMILQRTNNNTAIHNFSALIGLGATAGLLLCLVSIILGLLGVRTSDRNEKRNALLAIGISLGVLLAFAFYMYLGVQSPNFRPVR